MFEFLEGKLAARGAARLVLDIGGVGYDVAVPPGTPFPTDGDRTRVWTHLVVREDAHLLYGFPDAATRDLFRTLLSVRGVGPSVALGILSSVRREDFLATILAQDLAPLTAVRGVGRKTAEQILLDLRDKAALLAATLPEDSRPQLESAPTDEDSRLADAIAALVSIGYPEKEARKQVERAARDVESSDLELLVRTALQGS